MLSENSRRLLSELDWVVLQDRSSNHWQKLKRWKEQSITSLEDLALIANKTPDKMQDTVFTAQKIEPLIQNILKLHFHGMFSSVNKMDTRRTQLCTMLIRNCIKFCKLQYDLIEQDSPGLAETTLSQLDQSVKICDEIANKVEITNLRNIGTKTKLEFLFNWDKVAKTHIKLQNYLYEQTGLTLGISKMRKSRDGKFLRFELKFDEGEQSVYSVKITKNDKENKATVVIKDNGTSIERELIVRKVNDTSYVFKKIY